MGWESTESLSETLILGDHSWNDTALNRNLRNCIQLRDAQTGCFRCPDSSRG